MTSLEQIVRPFARPNTLARRRIIASSNKIEVPEAIISWGSAGTLPGAQEIEEIDPTGVSFEVITCDDAYDEVERETVNKRIENPNDSNDYVIVERPTTITFKRKEKTNPIKNMVQYTSSFSQTGDIIYREVKSGFKKCKSKYTLTTAPGPT